MRVEKSVEKSAEKTEKAEKPSSSSKKKKAAETEEAETKVSAKAAKTSKAAHSDDKKVPAKDPAADKVDLSIKAKKLFAAKEKNETQEINEAEKLMGHVESGKLSDGEKDLAMGRIGDILKKYGHI